MAWIHRGELEGGGLRAHPREDVGHARLGLLRLGVATIGHGLQLGLVGLELLQRVGELWPPAA